MVTRHSRTIARLGAAVSAALLAQAPLGVLHAEDKTKQPPVDVAQFAPSPAVAANPSAPAASPGTASTTPSVTTQSAAATPPSAAPENEGAPVSAASGRATARLHHAPVSQAPAHRALFVRASIDHPELVRRALLVYRTSGKSSFAEAEFRRAAPGPYVAQIPEGEVNPPILEYAVELELLDGTRDAVFATRESPERVDVPEDLMDARERAMLERLGGRRSVFAASGDYVDFGHTLADRLDPNGLVTRTSVHDNFYRVEGSFTYRPLRVVTEFSLRIGIVRGNSPVPLDDSQAPGKTGLDRFKVGLNYGAPTVRFRLSDICHLEGEFLTSVTETGFSVGTGGALLIGDPYGTKLTLGFESIQVFGTRFWSRMDIEAGTRVTIAPVIEVTNMPHAADYGVRLIGEISGDLGAGFRTSLRGGYQARRFTDGGPSAGATVGYAF
ncbi:MAG TPA: hypothetical protein VGI10_22510 [Polyangiaceae bacterium]|jgi:hypothetical protein